MGERAASLADIPAVPGGAGRERLARAGASLRPGAPILPRLARAGFAAEEFLRLALATEQWIASRGSGGSVIAVTSPDGPSGKTVTSLNLAVALAWGGSARILVVEGDLARPAFHRYLELPPSQPGFLQVREGKTELAETAVLLRADGVGAGPEGHELQVHVVPAGGQDPRWELLTTGRVNRVLAAARSSYDVTVFDTSAATLAGTRRLLHQADGVLVVVAPGRTRTEGIEELLSLVGREKLVGIVLNRVRKWRPGAAPHDA
jgi:Mrp family chromosome partitioning ATPase